MTPLLQIVHVTDQHITTDPELNNRWLARLARYQANPNSFTRLWAEGLAPHDDFALLEFETFCKTLTTEWDGPSWLLATGDTTTWGDDTSFREWDDVVDGVRETFDEVIELFGNHDAWPRQHPLLAKPAVIGTHRRQLRVNRFPRHWPFAPWRVSTDDVEVQLYLLNTVLHDKYANTAALGAIDEDRYWERGANRPMRDVQYQRLRTLVAATAKPRTLRIVATHHPVSSTPEEHRQIHPYVPKFGPQIPKTMVLRRRAEAARNLRLQMDEPIAHLVLSGHTHVLHPPSGSPLGRQLVTGSLSQVDALASHTLSNQFVVLRLFATPNEVIVQRYVAARTDQPGNMYCTGPFTWIDPTPTTCSITV